MIVSQKTTKGGKRKPKAHLYQTQRQNESQSLRFWPSAKPCLQLQFNFRFQVKEK
jgi:hypothetical protein